MSPPCNRNHGFCRARYPQSVWPRVPWAPARDRPASAAVAREPARERREHRHDTPLVDNDAKIASALAAERQAVIPALRAAVDELLEVERKNVKSERVHELARIADHLRARGRYVCAGPSCHKILIKPPRRPRNTNRWPLRGSRLRTSWINTARPSNPFRISVQLVVSHTCTPLELERGRFTAFGGSTKRAGHESPLQLLSPQPSSVRRQSRRWRSRRSRHHQPVGLRPPAFDRIAHN